MGRKLYVGNLPFSASRETLEATFSEYGTVESIQLVADRDTGENRGFGFVEMSSNAEAGAAMGALDGRELDGRAIRVNEAKPPAKQRGGGRGGFGGGSR